MSSLQLEALAAVCDERTFEAAAAVLHVTPSALSQRIAGLERQLGLALVRRTKPVRPTAAGETVLRLARQTQLLQSECLADLAGEFRAGERIRFALAINADSVSTWFVPALRTIAAEGRLLLDLYIRDQDHTTKLLRSGDVMAAVTTDPTPAQGCAAHPIGVMRYLPVAAPALLAGRDPAEVDLSTLPMLRFDLRDDLQHTLLRRLGIDVEPPIHYVPSNHEFLLAARLGLGWCVLPELQCRRYVNDASLIRVLGDEVVDVPLTWQRWRIDSTVLDHVTDLVVTAAHTYLLPSTSR